MTEEKEDTERLPGEDSGESSRPVTKETPGPLADSTDPLESSAALNELVDLLESSPVASPKATVRKERMRKSSNHGEREKGRTGKSDSRNSSSERGLSSSSHGHGNPRKLSAPSPRSPRKSSGSNHRPRESTSHELRSSRHRHDRSSDQKASSAPDSDPSSKNHQYASSSRRTKRHSTNPSSESSDKNRHSTTHSSKQYQPSSADKERSNRRSHREKEKKDQDRDRDCKQRNPRTSSSSPTRAMNDVVQRQSGDMKRRSLSPSTKLNQTGSLPIEKHSGSRGRSRKHGDRGHTDRHRSASLSPGFDQHKIGSSSPEKHSSSRGRSGKHRDREHKDRHRSASLSPGLDHHSNQDDKQERPKGSLSPHGRVNKNEKKSIDEKEIKATQGLLISGMGKALDFTKNAAQKTTQAALHPMETAQTATEATKIVAQKTTHAAMNPKETVKSVAEATKNVSKDMLNGAATATKGTLEIAKGVVGLVAPDPNQEMDPSKDPETPPVGQRKSRNRPSRHRPMSSSSNQSHTGKEEKPERTGRRTMADGTIMSPSRQQRYSKRQSAPTPMSPSRQKRYSKRQAAPIAVSSRIRDRRRSGRSLSPKNPKRHVRSTQAETGATKPRSLSPKTHTTKLEPQQNSNLLPETPERWSEDRTNRQESILNFAINKKVELAMADEEKDFIQSKNTHKPANKLAKESKNDEDEEATVKNKNILTRATQIGRFAIGATAFVAKEAVNTVKNPKKEAGKVIRLSGKAKKKMDYMVSHPQLVREVSKNIAKGVMQDAKAVTKGTFELGENLVERTVKFVRHESSKTLESTGKSAESFEYDAKKLSSRRIQGSLLHRVSDVVDEEVKDSPDDFILDGDRNRASKPNVKRDMGHKLGSCMIRGGSTGTKNAWDR